MTNIHKHYYGLFIVIVLLTILSLTSGCASQEAQPGSAVSAVNQKRSPASGHAPVKPEKKTHQRISKSGPDNPSNKIYLGSDGTLAGTGSQDRPVSEVYQLARGAHPKALSIPGLPKDKFGLIDWNRMVAKKIINPADKLDGTKTNTPLLDIKVLIHAKGDSIYNVVFRHKPHVYWLDCQNCHSGIFIMAKGKNNMTMQGIVKGKWCGRCHGKVSFPLSDCNRCHTWTKP